MIRPKVNGSVIFKNTHRTKDIPSNNQFFKTSASEKKDRFWLRISNSENKFNEQLIGYISGATSGFDQAYDGPINSLSAIKFYSFIESQKLIIQGKGLFNKTDVVNIGYLNSTTANSQLVISLSKAEGVFELDQKIYLHDKDLSVYHNLRLSPYTFTGNANTDNRFEIVYKNPNEVDEVIEENTIHGIVASIKNNTLSVTADLDIKNIVLYDILGKVVFEKEILNNTSQYNTDVNVSAGIYIAKVTLANNTIETKKIIAQ